MHFVCSYISGYFSTNDDECGRTQYDDEGVHGEQLAINAKLTIVKLIKTSRKIIKWHMVLNKPTQKNTPHER